MDCSHLSVIEAMVKCKLFQWFLMVYLIFGKFRVPCIRIFRWLKFGTKALRRPLSPLVTSPGPFPIDLYRALRYFKRHIPVEHYVKRTVPSWEYNNIASQLSPCERADSHIVRPRSACTLFIPFMSQWLDRICRFFSFTIALYDPHFYVHYCCRQTRRHYC